MLLVVSPNLAIDRILEVPNFRAGKVQRSPGAITQPGGKGSNAARVYRQLGGEVTVVGIVGRRNGSAIIEPLMAGGIGVDVVEGYDTSRTCTIVVDSAGPRHPTVINEESPVIDSGAAERFLAVVDKWLPHSEGVLVTGSLARGLDSDFYRIVLERARKLHRVTAVDATGAALIEAVKVRPDLLKVNAVEFNSLAGLATADATTVATYLAEKPGRFASQTIVTFGEAGAVLAEGANVWQAAPPAVFHINPIGSGDAFAAGYLREFLTSRDAQRSFHLALAAAASDANTLRPGHIVPEEVAALAGKTG